MLCVLADVCTGGSCDTMDERQGAASSRGQGLAGLFIVLIILGFYWDYIGVILGLYWDYIRVIYRDNGKENGNYYSDGMFRRHVSRPSSRWNQSRLAFASSSAQHRVPSLTTPSK